MALREVFPSFPGCLSDAATKVAGAYRAVADRAPHSHSQLLRERIGRYGFHTAAVDHARKDRR